MTPETLEPLLREIPAFQVLAPEHLQLLAGCAKNVKFQKGELIFRLGEPLDWFYALREGEVRLELHAPGSGSLAIDSLQANDLFGWSWLVPPYVSEFDARAHTAVRALALDGACLRRKCEADPVLGYALMKVVTPVVAERLHAMRLLLLDWYGQRP